MNTPLTYPRTIALGTREFTLRQIERSDAPALAEFAAHVEPHDLLFLQRDIRNPKVVSAWLDQMERGQIRSLIALENGHVVGCTALVRDEWSWSPHVAEIRLLISASTRGTGFGRVLAQECVATAAQEGVEKLIVRMTPDQGPALKVFEDMGFLPEALLRDHVRDAVGNTHDIAIMALNLHRQSAQQQLYGLGG